MRRLVLLSDERHILLQAFQSENGSVGLLTLPPTPVSLRWLLSKMILPLAGTHLQKQLRRLERPCGQKELKVMRSGQSDRYRQFSFGTSLATPSAP